MRLKNNGSKHALQLNRRETINILCTPATNLATNEEVSKQSETTEEGGVINTKRLFVVPEGPPEKEPFNSGSI